MSVEIFDTLTFEKAISDLNVTKTASEYGEIVFYIKPKTIKSSDAFIKIRSSIDSISGYSDGTGQDSIRFFGMCDGGRVFEKTIYITRLPGWQERLHDKVNKIVEYMNTIGICIVCHKQLLVKEIKKQESAYKGMFFASCVVFSHKNKWNCFSTIEL